MKFRELNRAIVNDEVQSSYEFGSLTVHLTSRFNNKVSLEDAMYDIVLQRLRSHSSHDPLGNPEGRHDSNGQLDKNAV